MTTNAPREVLGAGLPLRGTHDRFNLLDALDEAGQFGRDARDLSLKVGQALSRLAGRLFARGGVADVSTASRDTFHEPLIPELRVGVLHGHQGDAELLGVGPAAGEAVSGAERLRGDLVSDPGGDFAGVGFPLRL